MTRAGVRSTAIRAAWVLLLAAGSAGMALAQTGSSQFNPSNPANQSNQAMGPMAGRGDGRMFGGHHGPSMGPPGRWWDDPATAQQLGLTADQRKKMDDTFNTNRFALMDDMAALQKAEAVLEPLFAADSPNEGAILAQIGTVAEARAELEKAHARMLLALRAQMSHDQWVKLQALHPPRPEGVGGWRGEGGRMGAGGPGNGPGYGPGGGNPQGPPPGAQP